MPLKYIAKNTHAKKNSQKMTSHILKCKNCQKYTTNQYCECGGECITTKPGKFSIDDKYSKYRVEYKRKTQAL